MCEKFFFLLVVKVNDGSRGISHLENERLVQGSEIIEQEVRVKLCDKWQMVL